MGVHRVQLAEVFRIGCQQQNREGYTDAVRAVRGHHVWCRWGTKGNGCGGANLKLRRKVAGKGREYLEIISEYTLTSAANVSAAQTTFALSLSKSNSPPTQIVLR